MSVYSDVSIVVPTIRNGGVTFETVPEAAELIVRRDDGLNVARNAGVRAASNDWIVIADDDIEFPAEKVADVIQTSDKRTLSGLADFPPLRWVIGRLMIFHRALWEEVGGFDETRPHGGDTDFAIRVEKVGGTIIRLDREAVPHHDTDTGITMSMSAHLEWVAYLTRRHPVVFGPIGARILFQGVIKRVASSTGD